MIKVGAGGGGGHGYTYYTENNIPYGYAAPCGDGSIYGRGGNGAYHRQPPELVNISENGQKGLIILRG